MSDTMRLILAGVVRDFVDGGATRSVRYFDADDITVDDNVDDKCVLVTFQYVASQDIAK